MNHCLAKYGRLFINPVQFSQALGYSSLVEGGLLVDAGEPNSGFVDRIGGSGEVGLGFQRDSNRTGSK